MVSRLDWVNTLNRKESPQRGEKRLRREARGANWVAVGAFSQLDELNRRSAGWKKKITATPIQLIFGGFIGGKINVGGLRGENNLTLKTEMSFQLVPLAVFGKSLSRLSATGRTSYNHDIMKLPFYPFREISSFFFLFQSGAHSCMRRNQLQSAPDA